jgi:SAM-dependent methyltransferase
MTGALREGPLSQQLTSRCVCPRCRGPLSVRNARIACLDCGGDFPLLEGIPNFLVGGGTLEDSVSVLSEAYDRASTKYGDSPRSCGYGGKAGHLAGLRVLHYWIDYGSLTDKSVLDVGCGVGLMTSGLAARNDVWGVDISKGLLGIAREKGLKALMASCDCLPFKDGDFDLVLCVGVIPYFEDPRRILDELHRVTKKGGRIVVTSTADSVLVRAARFIKGLLRCPGHLSRLYSNEEIERYLVSTGGVVSGSLTGYKSHVASATGKRIPLRFKLLARTNAVMATIPSGND